MKTLQNGLLISIEGIDGSGKSVLSKNLHQALQEYQTVLTKEPGGTPLGEKIRIILLDKDASMCSKAEFLLFAASRAEHFNELVIPELKKGSIVISDRMADSSLVYQGHARGLDMHTLKTINDWAMNSVHPALTFYLKLDVATAMERIKQRNVPLTSFETEQAFIEKTVEGFEAVFADRHNVVILDANQTPEAITQEALMHVEKHISFDR